MIPSEVLLFTPLVVALAAIALALWAGSGMLHAATGLAADAEPLADRAALHLAAVKRLPQVMAAPSSSFAEEVREPAVLPTFLEGSPLEDRPIERLRRPGLEFIANFKLELLRCSASAGVDIGDLVAGARRLDTLVTELTSAENAAEVDAVFLSTRRMAIEIVQVLLSKCDHDIDPDRTNAPLQSSLRALARLCGLKLYLPEVGEPVDKRFHISLGVGARAGEALRGTVADVRARGLLDEQDAVITRAEIREYD